MSKELELIEALDGKSLLELASFIEDVKMAMLCADEMNSNIETQTTMHFLKALNYVDQAQVELRIAHFTK